MNHLFTSEELSIMSMYDHTDRKQLMQELTDTLPILENTEPDPLMAEVVRSAIEKLAQMKDSEFQSLPIFDAFPAEAFNEEG